MGFTLGERQMEGLTSRHRKTEEMSSCGAPEWTQEAFARLLCCEAVGSVLASEFLEPQGEPFWNCGLNLDGADGHH